MATNPGTVLQVVCNFNMLYIGCQYQVIKKVKKKRKADLPYLSFLQDEIGNTHIFFWPHARWLNNLWRHVDCITVSQNISRTKKQDIKKLKAS